MSFKQKLKELLCFHEYIDGKSSTYTGGRLTRFEQYKFCNKCYKHVTIHLWEYKSKGADFSVYEHKDKKVIR